MQPPTCQGGQGGPGATGDSARAGVSQAQCREEDGSSGSSACAGPTLDPEAGPTPTPAGEERPRPGSSRSLRPERLRGRGSGLPPQLWVNRLSRCSQVWRLRAHTPGIRSQSASQGPAMNALRVGSWTRPTHPFTNSKTMRNAAAPGEAHKGRPQTQQGSPENLNTSPDAEAQRAGEGSLSP